MKTYAELQQEINAYHFSAQDVEGINLFIYQLENYPNEELFLNENSSVFSLFTNRIEDGVINNKQMPSLRAIHEKAADICWNIIRQKAKELIRSSDKNTKMRFITAYTSINISEAVILGEARYQFLGFLISEFVPVLGNEKIIELLEKQLFTNRNLEVRDLLKIMMSNSETTAIFIEYLVQNSGKGSNFRNHFLPEFNACLSRNTQTNKKNAMGEMIDLLFKLLFKMRELNFHHTVSDAANAPLTFVLKQVFQFYSDSVLSNDAHKEMIKNIIAVYPELLSLGYDNFSPQEKWTLSCYIMQAAYSSSDHHDYPDVNIMKYWLHSLKDNQENYDMLTGRICAWLVRDCFYGHINGSEQTVAALKALLFEVFPLIHKNPDALLTFFTSINANIVRKMKSNDKFCSEMFQLITADKELCDLFSVCFSLLPSLENANAKKYKVAFYQQNFDKKTQQAWIREHLGFFCALRQYPPKGGARVFNDALVNWLKGHEKQEGNMAFLLMGIHRDPNAHRLYSTGTQDKLRADWDKGKNLPVLTTDSALSHYNSCVNLACASAPPALVPSAPPVDLFSDEKVVNYSNQQSPNNFAQNNPAYYGNGNSNTVFRTPSPKTLEEILKAAPNAPTRVVMPYAPTGEIIINTKDNYVEAMSLSPV